MLNKLTTNQYGQSVLELLVAMGIFIIGVSSIMFVVLDAHSANRQGAERARATHFASEGMEAAQSIASQGWRNVTTGNHGLDASKGFWRFIGTEDVVSDFHRRLEIADVFRDGSGAIVQTGGTKDFDTKRVTSRVSWDFQPDRPSEVTVVEYLTNWRSAKWIQTTQAEFDQGIKTNIVSTNTSGGELALTQSTGGQYWGNQFLMEGVSSPGNMNSAVRATAMRFTSQSSKKVATVRVYLAIEQGLSPMYRYGLQADIGGLPSGTWLGATQRGYGDLQATTTGWQNITLGEGVTFAAGTVYHLVVQPQGIPSNFNYIALRATTPPNQLIPLTNLPDTNAATLFNSNGKRWVIGLLQPLYELNFSDGTAEGNPYDSFVEDTLYGTLYSGELITISGADRPVTEVGLYVRKNVNQNPGDSLYVTLYDQTTATQLDRGVLVTAAGVSRTYAWYQYAFRSNISLISGHQYRIYLSSPGSNNQRYYFVSRLVNQAQASSNSINYDGLNSEYIQSSNGGTAWATVANADIGGFRFISSSGYSSTGDFISSAYDTQSAIPLYSYLAFTATVPAGTTLRFQLRSASTQAGLTTATWVGPDGNAGTYYDTAGQLITTSPSASGIQWIQYRSYFASTGAATPLVSDVTIDYE